MEDLFTEQLDEMRLQVAKSHRLLGGAPVPYRELLTDTFSKLDTALEELQVAEHELRQQNNVLIDARGEIDYERLRYHDLFEFAPYGYLVTDEYGIIQEANEVASLLLNLNRHSLPRKPLMSFVPKEHRSKFRQDLSTLVRLGYVYEHDIMLEPRGFAPFEAAVTMTAQKDSHGKVLALRWMLRDVSEQKRGERKLLALNAELEQRVDARTASLDDAYRRERKIANSLQRNLLPSVAGNEFDGLTVETAYEPAYDEFLVGGDSFDCFRTPDGCVALIVADISGKGLSAAFHTAEVRYSLRAFLQQATEPSEALRSLNNYLCRYPSANPEIFVVVLLALVDPKTGACRMSMAGSEPALIVRGNGSVESVKVEGLPLGVAANAEYATAEFVLGGGDRLVMLTDGITEARHGADFLTWEGVMRIIGALDPACGLDCLSRSIVQGARDFAHGRIHDDVCLLIAEKTS